MIAVLQPAAEAASAITVAAPLTHAHAAGAQVSGTGITLTGRFDQDARQRGAGRQRRSHARCAQQISREARLRALLQLNWLPLTLIGAALTVATAPGAAPARPQGPCDIYGAARTPCVAAHSTTRALYASYDGPLYQVKRQSNGRTLDIGLVQPIASPAPDGGGYADTAAQDAFCADTICVINVIYDQSGNGDHLYQAPPGPNFPGPAKGGFDTQPIADMAPNYNRQPHRLLRLEPDPDAKQVGPHQTGGDPRWDELASRGFYLLGDTLTVGTGRHQELVKVASVDTAGANGTDVDLAAPLQFDHQSGVDVSDVGPGSASRPPRNSRT